MDLKKTLFYIKPECVIDGVFTANEDILYVSNDLKSISCELGLKKIILPNVIKIGDNFLEYNNTVEEIHIPNVVEIGNNFMYENNKITKIFLPSVISIKHNFLYENNAITEINLPKVNKIGSNFLFTNQVLSDRINLPLINNVGLLFLPFNKNIKYDIKLVKSMRGDIYIGGNIVDKKEFIRKIIINKFLNNKK